MVNAYIDCTDLLAASGCDAVDDLDAGTNRRTFDNQYLIRPFGLIYVVAVIIYCGEDLREVGFNPPVGGYGNGCGPESLRDVQHSYAVQVGMGKIELGTAKQVINFSAFKILGNNGFSDPAKKSS